jgi:hypothetical protein
VLSDSIEDLAEPVATKLETESIEFTAVGDRILGKTRQWSLDVDPNDPLRMGNV